MEKPVIDQFSGEVSGTIVGECFAITKYRVGQEQLKIRTGFLIQKIILDNKCGHPTFGVDAIEKHFGDAGAFAETKSTEPGLYENKCLGKQLIAV